MSPNYNYFGFVISGVGPVLSRQHHLRRDFGGLLQVRQAADGRLWRLQRQCLGHSTCRTSRCVVIRRFYVAIWYFLLRFYVDAMFLYLYPIFNCRLKTFLLLNHYFKVQSLSLFHPRLGLMRLIIEIRMAAWLTLITDFNWQWLIIFCFFAFRCFGWSRQPRQLFGRDRGRHGRVHRVLGQLPQNLELKKYWRNKTKRSKLRRRCIFSLFWPGEGQEKKNN